MAIKENIPLMQNISIKKIGILLTLTLALCGYSAVSHAQGIDGGDINNEASFGAQQNRHKVYYIGGISVSGVHYADTSLIKLASGLHKGQQIKDITNDPAYARAIKKLWKNQLFSDIKIYVKKVVGDSVYLNLALKERPRLSDYTILGINKSQKAELKDKFKIVKNRMMTEALKKDIQASVFKYFSKKGYYNVTTTITEIKDAKIKNSIKLIIDINKGHKVHVNRISFVDNNNVSAAKLRSKMKDTKEQVRLSLHAAPSKYVYGKEQSSFGDYIKNFDFLSLSKTLEILNPYFRWNLFSGSKYSPENVNNDENNIINYYNSLGYRDARIAADTAYKVSGGNVNVALKVDEGNKYYFGNIKWEGNTKYSDSLLSHVLGIKKGDVYNETRLSSRLNGGPGGAGMAAPDITSLYMDDGYLFFHITPKETSINEDTINYLISIQEGPQAINNKITVSGNHKTNDYVLQRELFTKPGEKFSRAKVIRSIRQLSNLGYIDPEHVDPQIDPNLRDGTVDINYKVAEKSSDQLQLSAGFGAGTGFIGSVGIVFNNFSLSNILKPKTWHPLPMGDGQKLSIHYQSNGRWYNSANISFTEPWLGGNKPRALTISGVYGRRSYANPDIDHPYQNNYFDGNPNDHYLKYWGVGVQLSQRLKWPDNNFIFSYGVNYQRYHMKDYSIYGIKGFNNGKSNNLYFKLTLQRNSVDQPIFPRSGSNIKFTFQFTPPYSLFSDKDYRHLDNQEKYKWAEYHRYRFKAEWYKTIVGNLVFKFAAKYGFLGYYNKDLGYSPFERFQVGGDGMSGFAAIVGRDLISDRGYDIYAQNATVFNKYTLEIRYPFSLNPNSTIFGLAFVEAANGWKTFNDYNPFQLRRSAGLGIRIYLPMFGLLGLDYGIGFDRLGPGVKLGQAGKFTFMLGYEPD